MGNLTIELELVNNDTDCIINPDDNTEANAIGDRFTSDVALPAGNASNTSKVFELNNAFVSSDICTLDNNLNNEYVKHLLKEKDCQLPIQLTLLKCNQLQVIAILMFQLFVQYLN